MAKNENIATESFDRMWPKGAYDGPSQPTKDCKICGVLSSGDHTCLGRRLRKE